eukprot:TRINITY_DN4378_c0_g1_i1.p1 TRINITY_DN4378_c0_g1~~TRINITY_DN4378_c0_g1_i1.p1  ORF type:complete len:162 (+),score=27.58 TRINITY_DN4378_c0_g1_i1:340-825(+)
MNIEDDNVHDDYQTTQTPLGVDIKGIDEINLMRVEREEMRDNRHVSGSRRKSVGGQEPMPQRKKLLGSARLDNQINRICEAVEKRSTASSPHHGLGTNIQECINLLNQMVDIPRLGSLYLSVVNMFEKKELREIFVGLRDPEALRVWLQHRMDRASGSGMQ